MSPPSRRAVLWAAATLIVVALVDGVAARGRGRGGGGRGGGGFSRGGPAASGSFGWNRPAGGMDREFDARGPAADGSFGTQLPNRGERQERREERQEQRAERREDWQEYAEDHYEDHDGGYYGAYYGGYYGGYWTLPCTPTVMAMGGTVYYVCGSDWYVRAYSDGEVVYTMVPPPIGQ